MAFGVIKSGVIRNAVEASSDFAASQGWVALPEGVGIGWRYEEGEFLPPAAAVVSITYLVVYLDQRMVEVETGGTVWNGLPISTTERAQSKVDAALASYADGTRADNQMVTFIASDGSPQTIDQATLLSIKQAVVDHVAGSFTAYGVIYPQIIDGTITTREAIRDHVEWPSNGVQPQP